MKEERNSFAEDRFHKADGKRTENPYSGASSLSDNSLSHCERTQLVGGIVTQFIAGHKSCMTRLQIQQHMHLVEVVL